MSSAAVVVYKVGLSSSSTYSPIKTQVNKYKSQQVAKTRSSNYRLIINYRIFQLKTTKKKKTKKFKKKRKRTVKSGCYVCKSYLLNTRQIFCDIFIILQAMLENNREKYYSISKFNRCDCRLFFFINRNSVFDGR